MAYILGAMSFMFISLVALFSLQPSDAVSKPNILFIVADDLGWNDVGFNNPSMLTPNIDKLANQGLILNQSYVQPLCSPSRHSFMTGYYPWHAGLQHLVILPNQPVCSPLSMKFLPQYLKEMGYATHMVGKWHLGFCSLNCTPTYRGFDSFFGYYNAQEDYYNHDWQGGFDYRDGEKVATDYNGTYSMFTFVDKASNVINGHDVTKGPLFLYLPFQNVHDPLQVPAKYENMYPNIQNDGRRKFSGMVSLLDEAIGNVTGLLSSKGMLDDTIIVFTADNGGWPLYSGNNFPLRGSKFTIYEGGTRAVGFVKGPGLTVTGKRFDGLMHGVDWVPTMLGMAGATNVTLPPNIDGVNNWDALKTFASKSAREEVVYNLDNSAIPEEGHAAIRVNNWKLVEGYPGLYPSWYEPQTLQGEPNIEEVQMNKVNALGYQLYDLNVDPTEHNDVSSDHPDVVKDLQTRLRNHQKTYVNPNYPKPDPKSNPANYGGAWSSGWC